MVVPVDVAFGNGTPLACKAALRLWLLKSKPGIAMSVDRIRGSADCTRGYPVESN